MAPEPLNFIWERLTKELIQSSPLDLLIKLLAAVVVATLVYFLQRLLRPLWRWLWPRVRSTWVSSRRLARARDAVAEKSLGLWLSNEPSMPSTYDVLRDTKKLILTIANLKGGVGKTTIAANLTAYFANAKNDPNRRAKNVLAIDLDFQGSLSSMLFAGTRWQPVDGQLSHASELIWRQIAGGVRSKLGQPVSYVAYARGISAFYDLAATENRVMVNWLIGEETQDVRYRLADLLLEDTIRSHFDVVIIDAPPRLTTACVQALCASTHILIPTILDGLSADAVGYFGNQLKHHEKIWPHLKILGVVGSMSDKRRKATEIPALRSAGDALRAALAEASGSLKESLHSGVPFEFPYELCVPELASLGRTAGQGIAYTALGDNEDGRAVRKLFDRLGQEIERRSTL